MPPIRTKKITDVLVAHKQTSDTLKSRGHIEVETVIIRAEESIVASVEDGDEAEKGKNALVKENIPKPKKAPAKRRSPKKKAESPLPEPILTYNSAITNSLYHNIIIKTLDHALHRNIDWYAMSKEIKAELSSGQPDICNAKAKGKEKDELSGTLLCKSRRHNGVSS